ncbi:ATP-dependent dethiobiotin synthetase BioD [Sphingomonas ginsenosidivorax]|uniref:ATP-dependent dethiobiotin synthetase BioD n=1 Tax=Sphingomonas ginsenosidivorax TaxID=862135 RepID=A0A5C6U8T9_9SPHN|nr:dethiobiotin synthase [Sphingomonas ginsenosidivorax]TXC69533.1 ATP-dependent dethiobiotin synthetase BioD [Sphingomonas ginsenosidivorax]TXC72648.1 ATP-dependent dethiobiotin synthetase BioD [Sphingomonas ginsenosidivorax]
MTRTFVVTGTDTDIGKTVFAAGLAAALGASYWKPIQAGLDGGGDFDTVARLGVARIVPSAYVLQTPCSPHRAAEIDGVAIDTERLALPVVDGSLVVEGAGGVLVPVTRDLAFADLFARWRRPVVLVARTGLGTINHSLLSIEALRARGVPILGIAFIGDAVEDSEATIAAIGGVRRLGRLPRLDPLDGATLAAAFADAFDLGDFA